MEELLVPSKDLKTTKRFPPSLRGTIYESMLEAVSEELSVWRDQIFEQKTSFYNVDKMSLERLIEISGTFQVPFMTDVKSDLTFLQEEVRSIPFKIYYKGTPTLYKSFFYAINRYGEMFIYVYRADINNIMRSMLAPYEEAFLTPPNLPFRHRSRGDFSGSVEDWLKLDSDLFLDAGDALWKLDTSTAEVSTNHIGLEYFVDRVISRKDFDPITGIEKENDYLMTREYLDYINRNMEFGRRAKEVPHIGSQLSIQAEASGLCNSYDPTSEYTIPSLKLKAVVHKDFFSLVNSGYDITHVEFGIGSQKVASVENQNVPFPTKLNSRVCTIPVLFKDMLTDGHFVGAIGEYLGQSLSSFEILDESHFNGVDQNFDFVLPFAPIQRGNVTVEFRLPSGESLFVSDDRRGDFLSIHGRGTIDYKTGECFITTKFDFTQIDSMEPVLEPGQPDTTEGRTHFTHTLEGGTTINPESVWLTFTTGKDADQRTFMVNDTPNDAKTIGTFIHPSIKQGTINYSTKTVEIFFKNPLVPEDIKPFTCRYSFLIDYVLPQGTVLLASYFFTQQSIFITEAGFRSKDGVLLNYATFPPLEFNSTAYHLAFMFLVQKAEETESSEESEESQIVPKDKFVYYPNIREEDAVP